MINKYVLYMAEHMEGDVLLPISLKTMCLFYYELQQITLYHCGLSCQE